MPKLFLASLACALVVGCGSVPLQPAPPLREDVRLFQQEIPARPEAIDAKVQEKVAIGTTLTQATSILTATGFDCRKEDLAAFFTSPVPAEIEQEVGRTGQYARLHRKPDHDRIYCIVRKDVLGQWGKEYETVLVLLQVDRASVVQSIDTFAARKPHHCAEFFRAHPDLDEPAGLPLERAKERMEANGFRCSPQKDNEGHPCTLCEAHEEWVLGGKIIRVKLFTDAAGIVRDSEVVRKGELFDAERCMLPSEQDSRAQAWCKAAVFPVREATRVVTFTTLFAAGFTLVCFAHPY